MMKTKTRPTRDFVIWCLILALPYYLVVPFLLHVLGASWQFNCTAWGKTYTVDLLAVLSPVLFAYLAFITFAKFQLKKSAEPSDGANAALGAPRSSS